MNSLEPDLRRALRRVDAPEGFAERVRRRVHQPAAPRRWNPAQWASAATLASVAGGGVWYRAEEQRRAQGEEARRQVLLSLNIAGNKLRAIELKVNHAGER